MTGCGKSYGVGVLLEEMIMRANNYGLVVIDPLGVHCSLRTANDSGEVADWNKKKNEIKPRTFDCTIWIPKGKEEEYLEDMYDEIFSLSMSDISVDCFCDAFNLDPFSQQINCLRDAIADMRNNNYSISELIGAIGIREDYKDTTIQSLIGRLKTIKNLGIVSNNPVKLEGKIQKNKLSVFDLSRCDIETSRLIVNFLCEKLLKKRKKISRMIEHARNNSEKIKIADYIPPIQFIIDEFHLYSENNVILQRAIKTGRGSSFIMTLITQSFDLPKKVASNISLIFVGQMVNSDDIDKIRKMLPNDDSPKQFSLKVKNLQTGCFFYCNVKEKLFLKFKFRPRLTRHPATNSIINEEKYLVVD
jgi:hypothetical protein